jgi:C1A family cysteine protease
MEGKKLSKLFGLGISSKFQKVKETSKSAKSMKSAIRHKKGKKHAATKTTIHSSTSNLTTADFPESFDWRNVNGISYIPPVSDQGDCGSCYAVSTTDAINARYYSLLNLIPVMSISCSCICFIRDVSLD